MEKSNNRKDTRQAVNPLKKYKCIFTVGIFISCIISVLSIINIFGIFVNGSFIKLNQVSKVLQLTLGFTVPALSFLLIKVYSGNSPFKESVYKLLYVMGYLYIIISFLLPRLGGYVPHSVRLIDILPFELLYWPIFFIGIILLCFACIFKEAYLTRKENEEII